MRLFLDYYYLVRTPSSLDIMAIYDADTFGDDSMDIIQKLKNIMRRMRDSDYVWENKVVEWMQTKREREKIFYIKSRK